MHRTDNKHTKHRRRTPRAAGRLEREAGYLCAFADASLAETHPWISYGSGCILVVSGLAATIKKVSVHACSPCISSVISVKALPWKIITVNMALPNNNKLYYPNAFHWARVPLALLNALLLKHRRDWPAELEWCPPRFHFLSAGRKNRTFSNQKPWLRHPFLDATTNSQLPEASWASSTFGYNSSVVVLCMVPKLWCKH